ncbi:glycerol-3-phosphate dehydrogenase [Paenibacillus yonginensis]|uniref:Glycerol-3-phosphate dehydrogenase n=1 Tax=Paenibacillus yonginensis TaxID=1462996 RepID=A0A1B1N7F7_9BACL|nr:glycerol-3-phosphate dehydrogenase/oxidase [Paenibacillus yonginensis]ANS77379.1 glycerol-3-phosphate dehydrogenase [Paenibacillus yonginensis]
MNAGTPVSSLVPTKRAFSAFSREAILQQLEEGPLDVLIIGGGITGAGIALDAASRGLKTGLVEMQDFAAGTSSRSTKLVHGGLRYLKQLEIGVVAEVGKERAIVYENGPHVTTPEWMLLPFYEGGTFGPLSTSFGLRVYDFLAGVKKSERRSMLSPEETLRKEPLLKQEGLRGGGYYVEYRTDDARLTVEVMKKAAEYGAQAVNYTKVESLIYANEGGGEAKLTGVQITDLLSGRSYQLHAAKIVNAAGPWVDTIRELDRSKSGKTLRLTKGVHLVFDQSRFPLRQAVYFDTPDGRMVFAIPRGGKTYFGTTDTNYAGDIVHPLADRADRDYLLTAANFMFPNLKLENGDIESSWAGLRPLIQQEGKDPSEISRRDEIFHSPSGLISIAGGKLTGYRKMAEHVVDDVLRRLSAEGRLQSRVLKPDCQTKDIRISGGDVGGSAAFKAYQTSKIAEGEAAGLTLREARELAAFYGSNASEVFAYARDAETQAWAARCGLPLAAAARLAYAVEREMAVKPEDFLIRRTGWLFFNISEARRMKEAVIAAMAERLGWSTDQKLAYAEQMNQYLREAADAVQQVR